MKHFMSFPVLAVIALGSLGSSARAQVKAVPSRTAALNGPAPVVAAAAAPGLPGGVLSAGSLSPILSRGPGALNPHIVDLYPAAATPTDGMTYLLGKLGVRDVEQVLSKDASSQDWHYQIIGKSPEQAAAVAQALSRLNNAGTIKAHPEVLERLARNPALLEDAKAMMARIKDEGVRGLDTFFDGADALRAVPEAVVVPSAPGAYRPSGLLSPSPAPERSRPPVSREDAERIIAEHEARKSAAEAAAGRRFMAKAGVSAGTGLLAALPVYKIVKALVPYGSSSSDPIMFAMGAMIAVSLGVGFLFWLGSGSGSAEAPVPDPREKNSGAPSRANQIQTRRSDRGIVHEGIGMLVAGLLSMAITGATVLLAALGVWALYSRYPKVMLGAGALALGAGLVWTLWKAGRRIYLGFSDAAEEIEARKANDERLKERKRDRGSAYTGLLAAWGLAVALAAAALPVGAVLIQPMLGGGAAALAVVGTAALLAIAGFAYGTGRYRRSRFVARRETQVDAALGLYERMLMAFASAPQGKAEIKKMVRELRREAYAAIRQEPQGSGEAGRLERAERRDKLGATAFVALGCALIASVALFDTDTGRFYIPGLIAAPALVATMMLIGQTWAGEPAVPAPIPVKPSFAVRRYRALTRRARRGLRALYGFVWGGDGGWTTHIGRAATVKAAALEAAYPGIEYDSVSPARRTLARWGWKIRPTSRLFDQ